MLELSNTYSTNHAIKSGFVGGKVLRNSRSLPHQWRERLLELNRAYWKVVAIGFVQADCVKFRP